MLAAAQHGDPFSFLGVHEKPRGFVCRCFMPRVRRVCFEADRNEMKRVSGTDLFEYHGKSSDPPAHPLLIWEDDHGVRRDAHHPYCFAPAIHSEAMKSFHDGKHYRAQELLGARVIEIDDIRGTLFSVWAPNARRVSVVGDFNQWDGRNHPMRFHPGEGIWELFVPGLFEGPYKFEILNGNNGEVHLKSDPFARASEKRPATASLIARTSEHHWGDGPWLQSRNSTDFLQRPLSIYEVHLGSWRRRSDGGFLDYRALAHQLCEYVRPLGFTHIELLPMKEHPLDDSWGYQCTGYFSPTSRHGKPDDFRFFVDHCHQNGLGVILDWVPAHFPKDAHGLARFDGGRLFEYFDDRKAEHLDWGTLVFNYERNEVRSFLISSALYWLQEYHLDGLRVDAVASMLYLNFSRQAEQWAPNKYGGHENLEAMAFIRELNSAIRHECPGCLTIAEESTDWQGITHPVDSGGLGFSLKWNMGWMHDTLNYMSKDPIYRKHHQDWLTFGPVYAFNENFVLPLSHDEVVHLKKSLLGKMPGDEWQQFANLRLLYCYQWFFPGKELLFMGGEFGQDTEWNANAPLPWHRAGETLPRGVTRLVAALNRMQARFGALHQWDCDKRGFEWLDGDDADNSVIAFLRHGEGESLAIVFNFTPMPRADYRIPIHKAGNYQMIFSSDSEEFGGSGLFQVQQRPSEDAGKLGRPQSLKVELPPLAAVVFQAKQ